MARQILLSVLPFLAMILASLAALRLLVWASGAQRRLSRLAKLAGDQEGGVQSLSFVLTLPVFVIVMMFIVQLSQITIGKIAVEYAAFAAARSAAVWIPANFGPGYERTNQIGPTTLEYVAQLPGDNERWTVYNVVPGGDKWDHIFLAAAEACLAVCPSRNVGAPTDDQRNAAYAPLLAAYRAIYPQSASNERVPPRIANKLAYALAHTRLKIEVRHKEDLINREDREEELALLWWDVPPDRSEYTLNEIGWQDQITVQVEHDFALLPGPAALLGRRADDPLPANPATASAGTDRIAKQVQGQGSYRYWTLSATVRTNNEGEKPVLRYLQKRMTGAGGGVSEDTSYLDEFPPEEEEDEEPPTG